ncbi:MAG: NfeD family protein [Planctomycetaceae bacterium]
MVDYSLVAILLLLVGLAILIAEILIPSGGIIGVVAVLCLAGSFWAAWIAWWENNQIVFWVYIGSLILFVPTTIAGAFYILPKTPIGKKLFLDPPREEEVIPFLTESQKLQQLVGQVGRSLTMHNSGGMVRLGSKRYHSESEGVLIEPDTPILVIGVKGNSLLVREISKEQLVAFEQNQQEDKTSAAEKTKPSPPNEDLTASSESNVDFEIP